MNRTQWTVAAVLLAAMVFGITFAMNYLGGRGGSSNNSGGNQEDPLRDTIRVVEPEQLGRDSTDWR